MKQDDKSDILVAAVETDNGVSQQVMVERWRIVKSFVKLLAWVEKNIPLSVNLPFHGHLVNGIFSCRLNNDDLTIRIHDPQQRLTHDEENVIIRLLELHFVELLRNAIKESTRQRKRQLAILKKIKVPEKV